MTKEQKELLRLARKGARELIRVARRHGRALDAYYSKKNPRRGLDSGCVLSKKLADEYEDANMAIDEARSDHAHRLAVAFLFLDAKIKQLKKELHACRSVKAATGPMGPTPKWTQALRGDDRVRRPQR